MADDSSVSAGSGSSVPGDAAFVWDRVIERHERELADRETVNDACLRTVRITILFVGVLLPGLRLVDVQPNATMWLGMLCIWSSIGTGFLAYAVGERKNGLGTGSLAFMTWTAAAGQSEVVFGDSVDSYLRYVHRNSRGTNLIAAVLSVSHALLVVGILLVGLGMFGALGPEGFLANASQALTSSAVYGHARRSEQR